MCAEHKLLFVASQQIQCPIGGAPRHDVVLARREHEDRQLYRSKVDGHAAVGQRAGLAQPVLQVSVAQVVAVHRAGQVGAVGVPVEEIEGRRLPAAQVVVDHVGPDQIVGAQAGEHEGEVLPGQDAAGADGRLARRDARLVDEQADLTRLREIQHRREERRARHQLRFLLRQNGERRAQQGSADAKPQGVDLIALGDFLRYAQRGEHAVLEVIVPAESALRRLDVAPGHHEYGVARRHRMGDERILGLQIEDVELVDARRDHHQRTRRDLRGGGLVLDQLDQLVLEHHVAGRHRQVAADLEGSFVGLADAALLHVAQQVGQAARQALAARRQRLAQRIRVGGGKIRRAHRVDPLPRGEAHALLRLRLEHRRLDQLFEIARGEQIGLLQVVVVRVLAPFPGRETPVAGLG